MLWCQCWRLPVSVAVKPLKLTLRQFSHLHSPGYYYYTQDVFLYMKVDVVGLCIIQVPSMMSSACPPQTRGGNGGPRAWRAAGSCGEVMSSSSAGNSKLIQFLTYLNKIDHLLKERTKVCANRSKGLWLAPNTHTHPKDSDESLKKSRSFEGKSLQSSLNLLRSS